MSMTKKSVLSLLAVGLLAGCVPAASGPISMPLQERLRNPLVAERYWSELAEHMADFIRTKDPIMEDPIKLSIIDSERLRALERVANARTIKDEGTIGLLKPAMFNEDAFGEVLLHGRTLYFSSTFEIKPNPSAYVYLSTNVDPRNGAFPDPTAVNLGALQTAFGPQQFEVPESATIKDLRTVVLYDTRLQKLIGFAQLN
ncbi:hypothetical protein EXS70_03255 [Candidatus Peribacteria bacterium]|nr:hypothetical protein [Candidatus Peribacteria bacterium]